MYVLPRDGKIAEIPGNPAHLRPQRRVRVGLLQGRPTRSSGPTPPPSPSRSASGWGPSEMSLQTARRTGPEDQRPGGRGGAGDLGRTGARPLLGGIETQMSQGGLDPIVAARIEAKLRSTPAAHFADIYVEVHEEMQKEQAAQQAQQQSQPAIGVGPPGLPAGPPPPLSPEPPSLPVAQVLASQRSLLPRLASRTSPTSFPL